MEELGKEKEIKPSHSSMPVEDGEEERVTSSPKDGDAMAIEEDDPGSQHEKMETESAHPQPQQKYRNPEERPVYLLSVKLLKTYKHINEVYYAKKRKTMYLDATLVGKKKVYNDGYDDEDGNYIIHKGEEILQRYIVTKVLGKGSFSVVAEARDMARGEGVAIKIIKNRSQFHQQAKLEIRILRQLNEKDPHDRHYCVRLRKYFEWRNHLVLVFELCAISLYELLRYTHFRGVSLYLVRKFAYQVADGLQFLAEEGNQVIHCDLKPENILLRNLRRSGIKIIDFGSSTFAGQTVFKYIQSRFYRSPEVILGLKYGMEIDMWSLGCILVEMHTGYPVFDGRDEASQIVKIFEITGFPTDDMIKESPKWSRFFYKENSEWVCRRRTGPINKRSLREIIGVESGGPGGRRRGEKGHSQEDYEVFLDLVEKMLVLDPKNRIKPSEVLVHDFFKPLLDSMVVEGTKEPSEDIGIKDDSSSAAARDGGGEGDTRFPDGTGGAESGDGDSVAGDGEGMTLEKPAPQRKVSVPKADVGSKDDGKE